MRVHRQWVKSLTAAALAAASTAHARPDQSPIFVNCGGASIPANFDSTPDDIVRTTTDTIFAAPGYRFDFNPTIDGTGFANSIPTQPLAALMNSFYAGGQRVLYGAVRNPTGLRPTLLDTEEVGGLYSGFTVSFTLVHQVLADGRGRASVVNIQRPILSGLDFLSGGLNISTWTPPAAVKSEWHFDGNLQSVRESGLAPGSGPAKVRYLDDPAFGPILGGDGGLEVYPTPATPTGITAAQSAFGTASGFGLPLINGHDDTVYRTSPPRNPAHPTDTQYSRGIGLTLWPNTRDYWPEDRNGQWTMVWDLLIPQDSWEAARSGINNNTSVNQCIPLVETSSNNNSAADTFLRVSGASPGSASVGQHSAYAAATPAPAIQPGVWFRLAVVTDHYGTAQSRIFVNGAFVGVSKSDWVYNACKSTDPRWGDPSATNTSGTALPGATWSGWGQFPSPWAQLPVTPPNTLPAYMSSTLSLFADLTGRGESVYVANMLFTDEAMSDAAVAALGGPNSRGISYLTPLPCAADFNGSGSATVQDIFDFLAAWFGGCTAPGPAPCIASADFNGVGGVSVQDIFDFLAAWFGGC